MITQVRIDEVVPGDMVSHYQIGPFDRVDAVRYVDVEAPGRSDRVELRVAGGSALLGGFHTIEGRAARMVWVRS